jgi:hypothetical protein
MQPWHRPGRLPEMMRLVTHTSRRAFLFARRPRGCRLKTFFANYIDDILYIAGAALITTGAYRIQPIAALFVAGIFCLHFAYLIGKAKARA